MSQPIAVAPTNPRPGSVHPIDVKIRYTKSADTTGWLRVKLEPSGDSGYLCEFVKVAISDEGERTHFLILEGTNKGLKASLSKANAAKCLIAATRGNGAKLVAKQIGRKWLMSIPHGGDSHNQLMATLSFDGKTATISLDSDVDYPETNVASPDYKKMKHSKPLPKGTYRILAPQNPKSPESTGFYATNPGGYPDLKYDTVWFPIEYAATLNSNFVHVGNISEGCVTMYELSMWNSLYAYLIKNRSDKEGKYVGTVTIE